MDLSYSRSISRLMRQRDAEGAVFISGRRDLIIADYELANLILKARVRLDAEKSVTQPIRGFSLPQGSAALLMESLSSDLDIVAANLGQSLANVEVVGPWPRTGRRILTPLLVTSLAEGSRGLTPPRDSRLARTLVATMPSAEHATAMRARITKAVSDSVSVLVTSMLAVASCAGGPQTTRNVLLEALRLAPPAWIIRRVITEEIALLDDRLHVGKDLYICSLLIQTDPRYWGNDRHRVCPQRWSQRDSFREKAFLPFGAANSRCWTRKSIVTIAEAMYTALGLSEVAAALATRRATVKVTGGPLLSLRSFRIPPSARVSRR